MNHLKVRDQVEETTALQGDEFLASYIHQNRPVIVRGGAASSVACQRWCEDNYLRSKAGDTTVWPAVTESATPTFNHQARNETESLNTFLNSYHDNPRRYINATDLPEVLFPDLPQHAVFDAFATLEDQGTETGFYLGHGDQLVQPHYDDEDNLFTLISGHKTFLLSDPGAFANAEPCNNLHGPDFTSIDVSNEVQLASSRLMQINWFEASLNPGDILYVPGYWWHIVQSAGRHMALTIVRTDRLTQVLAFLRLLEADALPISESVRLAARELIEADARAQTMDSMSINDPILNYLSLGLTYRRKRLLGNHPKCMEEEFAIAAERQASAIVEHWDYLPMVYLLQNFYRIDLGMFDE